jgi:GNAT superfamily N-acetyltransferase
VAEGTRRSRTTVRPDEDQLVAEIDDATAEFLRETARRTVGGTILEQDGVLLVGGSDPTPVIVNSAIPVHPTVEPHLVVRACETFFGARGHGYGIFTREHLDAALDGALAAAGYQLAIELPVMVVDEPPSEEPISDAVTIGRVETTDDRVDWITANLTGFCHDDDDRAAVRSAFDDDRSLVGGRVAGFVARDAGRPVAASMVCVSEGIAIVGWVGTVPEHRRRGIGAAVTRAATIAGFELGARAVALQASPMGHPVYARMGFRTVGRYRVWTPAVSH